MRRFAILTMLLLAGTLAFAQQKQPKFKSKGEQNAFQVIVKADDLDARIKACDDFLTKYADSELKGSALYFEADAYMLKGDSEKATVYAEQTLAADPSNLQANVLLGRLYATSTHVNDLDKEEKLTKTIKYSNDALELLKTVAKPNPTLTDAEWQKHKDDFAGQCYFSLGIAAVYHNKLDEVKTDFDKTAELDTDPTDLIRAGRALLDVKKPDLAIEWFDKAAASPAAPDQIKKIAAADKARAQSMIKK
jgi:tetratricopeptide (TPR) repeat protein